MLRRPSQQGLRNPQGGGSWDATEGVEREPPAILFLELRVPAKGRETLVSAEKRIAQGRKVLALSILDATFWVPPSGRNTPCHVEQHLLCSASHSGGEAE